MKEKLTIHNDNVSWDVALECVRQVINMGRISDFNKSYCFHTMFETSEGSVSVSAAKRKKSDTFYVYGYNRGADNETQKDQN